MKYVIGDIHANVRELERLLGVLSLQKGDALIFLGDYIDKRPTTQETLALLSALRQEYACTFIKGNHDYVWDRYLNGNETDRQEFLLRYGGREALHEYGGEALKALETNDLPAIALCLQPYLELIQEMKDWLIVDEYLALHAGLCADQYAESPLIFREENFFMRPEAMPSGKKYLGRHRLVVGHTHLSDEPTVQPGYVNIDLGAGYDGFLGTLAVEENAVVRSDGKKFPASYVDPRIK